MSDTEVLEKRITEVEKILLICNLDPTIAFRTMAKMIVAQLDSKTKFIQNNNQNQES